MLQLHRRQAAGRPAADRHRRHQRAARSPPRLVELAREHDVLPVAIVLDLPEKRLRGAERRPPGPGLRPARAPPPARPAPPRRCAGLQREGFRTVHVLHGRRARSPRPTITRTRLYTDLRARDRAVRHHRRRARLPGRAGAAADRRSATRSTATTPGRAVGAATRRGARGVPRRPGRPRPGHARACCASSWAWSRPGPPSACRATTRASCCARCAGRKVSVSHGLDAVHGAARRRRPRVPRRGQPVPRRPDQPLRAGRRAGWWSRTPA